MTEGAKHSTHREWENSGRWSLRAGVGGPLIRLSPGQSQTVPKMISPSRIPGLSVSENDIGKIR